MTKWLLGLLGNSPKTVLFIGLFILILCTLFWRCSKAAEVDLRAGSAFAHGTGPVLGLQLYFPVENRLDVFAGTLLYGATATDPNNWSWEVGVRSCRW